MYDWTRVLKAIPVTHKFLFQGISPIRSNENLNSSHEVTLLGIYDNPGQSQKEIIRYINKNKGSISKIIQNLVELGLVKRQASDKDRREVLLTLSEEGEKEALRIHDKFSNHIAQVLSVLDEEKRNKLYDSLDSLLEIVSEAEKIRETRNKIGK